MSSRGAMVQIKKLDRQVSTTGTEESKQLESSGSGKPKSSKGIAESESKFETAKPNSLFQSSAYSTVRSAENKNENLVRNLNTERHSSSSSTTTSITDGTSNTIVVGEQNTASTPEASTNPASQDQEAGTPVTGRDGDNQQTSTTTITDGTSNTIMIGEQSSEPTQEQSTNPASQDQEAGTPVTGRDGDNQQTSTTTITDGTSNTIVVGEQNTASTPEASTNPASQDQEAGTPVTERDNDNQQTGTTTITDGTSNTLIIGEQSTEDTSEASSDTTNQDQQVDESTSSSTTEISDGTSNTIILEG